MSPSRRRRSRKLGHAVAVLDPFRLAALSPLVTIGGSLVAALAVLEQAIPADAAWEAVSLDERWQLEQWGGDAEAEAALDATARAISSPRRGSSNCSVRAFDQVADEGHQSGLALALQPLGGDDRLHLARGSASMSSLIST